MQRLGDLQLQVMELVWQFGRATVSEVYEELRRHRKIAYTTVLTTMRALERHGMVAHEARGKAYLYHPLVSRDAYTEARLDRFVDDLFDGRKEKLLCHLLGAERVSAGELRRIRRMLSENRTGK